MAQPRAETPTPPNDAASAPPEQLSLLDASFLYVERPTELLHVGALAILATTPPFDDVVAGLGARLGRLRRYRQIPTRSRLDWRLPVWRDAARFDVRHHVHRTVLAAGDDATLRREVDAIFARPFAPDRPLWECHVLEGLGGGRSAMLLKVHHCMIDGISGVQILELLTEAADGLDHDDVAATATAADGRHARPDADGGWLAQAVAAVTHPRRTVALLQDAVAAGGALAGLALSPAPALPWHGTLGAARAIRWQTFDLDRLLAMRGVAGCKVNDVALAVIAGALRSMLSEEQRAARPRARALVPVSVRRTDEHLTLGNRVSARFASLPLDVADPRECLRLIADEMRRQKTPAALQPFDVALAVAAAVPAAVTPWLLHVNDRWPIVSTVCTNVPGPREIRTLAGARVTAIYPMVPLAAGIGLGFAMLSYAGAFTIVATADPDLVADVDRLPAALAAAEEELAASLGVAGAATTRPAAPAGTRVQDLMSRAVTTIAPDTRLSAIWRLMRSRQIRHLPVVDGAGCLRGLVTHRDVLAALPSSLGTELGQPASLLAYDWAEARDLMETHLSTVAPTEPASVAGHRMASQKIGCLPVVGARGELVGILTEADFVRWATERL